MMTTKLDKTDMYTLEFNVMDTVFYVDRAYIQVYTYYISIYKNEIASLTTKANRLDDEITHRNK